MQSLVATTSALAHTPCLRTHSVRTNLKYQHWKNIFHGLVNLSKKENNALGFKVNIYQTLF